MTKDLTWIKTNYFAHRGLYNNDDIPENTIAAFLNAVDHGYDIECDVRLTKDDQLIVFHDETLHRLAQKDMIVCAHNYNELKTMTLLDTKETIPLLKNVLDALPQTTAYLIEFKPVKSAKRLVTLFLELMDNYEVPYAIHSYDPFVLYQFKKQAPQIIRGQISETFPNKKGIKYFLLKHMAFNCLTKPDFINYRFEDLPRKQLDKLRHKGMPILSFSARSEADLAFVKMHYDNAVFEHFMPKKRI
ncbi:MAG: glycerophosphodiester phosphodiesterase [Candidatus Izimaplasma sp.]|nr:glycerophosphodiester phosphodiesterase [Candidatus Izimaplasma bacterium]